MEKFDPIDVEFLINSAEVKADAKKVKDEIHGIGKTADEAAAKVNGVDGGGIAAPLNNAGKAAEASGKKAAAARPQWNGLGNSINQLSREIPAFTYSAQTGFLALSNNIPILADEIGRLKAQNDALVASGQKGVPIWKQVVKGLVSWQTALSLGVAALTIFGPQIIDFISNLMKGKVALDKMKESKELLNKAFEGTEFTDAIKEVTSLKINLDLAKEGLLEKKTVVDQYNKSIGKTAKDAKTLDDVEKGLIENADLYIEMTLKKAAANLALQDAAKKAYEAAQIGQKEASEFADLYEKDQAGINTRRGTDEYGVPVYDDEAYKKSLKEAGAKRQKAQIDQKEEEQKTFEEIAAKFQRESAEAASKFRDPNKEDPKGDLKAISDRKNLLEKIADLDREYARKQMERDDEELQALRDKFLKVRELIEEFNKDPKNFKNKIDVTGLGAIQEKAEADLVYKQETRAIKEELDKQKILYKEIEEFKAKFGIEKTKERYGEELKKYDDYAAAIRQRVVNNQAAFDAVENGTATPAQAARVQMLDEATKGELKKTRENYIALLEDFMTYQDKKKLLLEKFNADYNKLVLERNFEEAEKRKRVYEQELGELNDVNLKKMDAYEALFSDVGRLTIQTGKKIIADAKRLMKTQEMSAETRAKIMKLIADTEFEISKLKADNVLDIAEAFGQLGESLNAIGSDIGNASLRNVGGLLSSLAGGVGELMKALEFDEDTDDLERMQTALKATIQLINMMASAAAQRRAAEEEYYNSVLSYQNSYNLSLNEQIRLQSILNENVFIRDFEGRITDANEAIIDATAGYQDALEALEDGQVKTGQRSAIDWGNVGQGAASGAALGASFGGFIGAAIGAVGGALVGLFGGRRTVDVFGDLLTEYPELLRETEEGVVEVNEALAESLLQSGLLDEATQGLVQNVLDWQNAIQDARAQIREVIVDLTGSLSSDLRNALVDAFESGESAAEAMGDTVEKVLENIISNILFNQIFSKAFEDLEAQMAASYDLGGDRSWVDDFTRFFNDASGLTDDFNQAMRDAQAQAAGFGFDIFNPDEEDEQVAGLQGAIRREMTEETASELTGLFRGQYDITKRHLQLHERHFELAQRDYDATRSIMQYSAFIEQNTAATVVELKLAVTELKAINTNTRPAQSARDLGRG